MGQGVAGYGNDIKDAVGVGGKRVPTAGNPIGLAGPGGSKNFNTANKPKGGSQVVRKTTPKNPLGLS